MLSSILTIVKCRIDDKTKREKLIELQQERGRSEGKQNTFSQCLAKLGLLSKNSQYDRIVDIFIKKIDMKRYVSYEFYFSFTKDINT